MKRIGILTLVFYNYGTRLQSYALCKVVKSICGQRAEVEVINLETPWRREKKIDIFKGVLKHYGIHTPRKFLDCAKWRVEIKSLVKDNHSQAIDKRVSLFNHILSLIPYTKEKYKYDDIRRGELSGFDIFLVGSDQVWNDIKVGNQDVFMLDFLKNGKGLTYAASFGMTHFPKATYSDYKKRIKNFSSLLIREQEGLDMCRQLGRDDAHWVLDPTMLLDKSVYMGDLSCAKEVVSGKYILLYSLNMSMKIYEEVSKLAKRTGCKMVVLKRAFNPPIVEKHYPDAIELYAISPEEFLWLIDNAQCVVTNSYHALLFSINFKTDFYLYLDNADEENSRLLTITKMCNLQNRIYWETGHLPNSICSIDFGPVEAIIQRERTRSLGLLRDSLEKVLG